MAQWKPGQSGNKTGRPKGPTALERFRDNDKCECVINKVIKVALTLNTKEEHKDAMNCCKIVMDKVVPSLKATEMKIESEHVSGFVILPTQTKAPKKSRDHITGDA